MFNAYPYVGPYNQPYPQPYTQQPPTIIDLRSHRSHSRHHRHSHHHDSHHRHRSRSYSHGSLVPPISVGYGQAPGPTAYYPTTQAQYMPQLAMNASGQLPVLFSPQPQAMAPSTPFASPYYGYGNHGYGSYYQPDPFHRPRSAPYGYHRDHRRHSSYSPSSSRSVSPYWSGSAMAAPTALTVGGMGQQMYPGVQVAGMPAGYNQYGAVQYLEGGVPVSGVGVGHTYGTVAMGGVPMSGMYGATQGVPTATSVIL